MNHRRAAKANRGMAWTTPAGFRVLHETREPKTLRIVRSDRTFVVYQEDENTEDRLEEASGRHRRASCSFYGSSPT